MEVEWSNSILGHVTKYLGTRFIQGKHKKINLKTGKKSSSTLNLSMSDFVYRRTEKSCDLL
jgi:hypothetical protein